MHGHQPTSDARPPVPTIGSGVKPAGGRVLLRGADRRLLQRCLDALTNALDDTAEDLVDPDRKPALEELIADVAEELGANVIAPPPETAEPGERFVTLASGAKKRVVSHGSGS